MRRSLIPTVAVPALLLTLAGCREVTGPTSADYLDLSLDFCSAPGQFPVFFAFQNEGEPWRRVTGDNNRTFAFRASDKVGIAMIFQEGSDYASEIVYAKNEELEPFSGGVCAEATGSKSVSGSVSGVAAGDFAYVTMGLTTEFVTPPPATFTLVDLATAPIDLVASSAFEDFDGALVPDAVIIRRAIAAGATTVSTVDFNGSEAALPATSTLSISGLAANQQNLIDVYFSTATTFDHPLFLSGEFTGSTQTIYQVPGALTQAGDLHMLDMYARGSTGLDVRGETQWYRTPGNRSVALGTALSTPTIAQTSISPVVRYRATLPVQPEYNSFALALFNQVGTVARSVSVLGTAGYFDSPSTWQLDIPDLSGVSGFPTAAGLQSGGIQTPYQVAAYSGDLATFFGAAGENASMKYAARSSSTNTLRALRDGDAAGRHEHGRAVRPPTIKRRFGVR